jgi:protein O-mannosyl-transferase
VAIWNHPIGFWQEMLEQFPRERDLEHTPASHVLFSLGVQQALRGDVAAAAVSLGAAVNVSPDYADARYNLGKALVQLGRLDEAVMHLQKAVELSPDYWQAHNTLGVALAQKGRTPEAVEHFRRAVELKPDDVSSRKNLEMALEELESKEKAQDRQGQR